MTSYGPETLSLKWDSLVISFFKFSILKNLCFQCCNISRHGAEKDHGVRWFSSFFRVTLPHWQVDLVVRQVKKLTKSPSRHKKKRKKKGAKYCKNTSFDLFHKQCWCMVAVEVSQKISVQSLVVLSLPTVSSPSRVSTHDWLTFIWSENS